jgi:hypothetical protein
MGRLQKRGDQQRGIIRPVLRPRPHKAKDPHNCKPPDGYVPNADTAILIALAVWLPTYGKARIDRQAPYRAELNGGIWTVRGSLPPDHVGGVALAEIAKDDG